MKAPHQGYVSSDKRGDGVRRSEVGMGGVNHAEEVNVVVLS